MNALETTAHGLQPAAPGRLQPAPKSLSDSLPSGSGGSGRVAGGGGERPQKWGTTELSARLAETALRGRLTPTDVLLVERIYAHCTWPETPHPPTLARTRRPFSLAWVAQWILLKRSGTEAAVARLKGLGWLSTERCPETGFCFFVLHIGRILADCGAWGRWTVETVKASRPPSRRARPQRQPRGPSSPRPSIRAPRPPRSMPIARTIGRWRQLFPRSADPTSVIADLLRGGVEIGQIDRAITLLDASGMAQPPPRYIRDRVLTLPEAPPAAEAGGPPAAEASTSAGDPPAAEASTSAGDPPAADAPPATDPTSAEVPPTTGARRRRPARAATVRGRALLARARAVLSGQKPVEHGEEEPGGHEDTAEKGGSP